MTTENNEQTRKTKVGCGTMILVSVGVICLFIYFYISGLANGFSNS